MVAPQRLLSVAVTTQNIGVRGPTAVPVAAGRRAPFSASQPLARAATSSVQRCKRGGVSRRHAAAPEAAPVTDADARAAGSANNCVPAGAILGQPAAAPAAAAAPDGEAAVAAAVAAAAATVLQPAAQLPLPLSPPPAPQPAAYPRIAALHSLSSIDEEELVEGHDPEAFLSSDGEEEGMVEGHLAPVMSSRDEFEEASGEGEREERGYTACWKGLDHARTKC